MYSLLQSFFQLGLKHILDLGAYDHMLFLLALCIPFLLKDWKKVAVLATAFTIGHSITLALAVFDVIRFSSAWVEFLIPLTIVFTAGIDFFFIKKNKNSSYIYPLALAFGLIHGMGFSNFLRASLFPGEEHKMVWQLLSFNLGIEIAQVIIVLIILSVLTIITKLVSSERNHVQLVLAILTVVWAMWMCVERWPGF